MPLVFFWARILALLRVALTLLSRHIFPKFLRGFRRCF